MYFLTAPEKERLTRGVQGAFAVPFVDDVEDFIWEAILSYVKGVPLVDPLTHIRKKLLFDVVDETESIGWSCKTVQWAIRPSSQFELVIQRADIVRKSEQLGFGQLTRDSSTDELGLALLTHWYNKVYGDAETQGVDDMRVCILLKSRDRKSYAYYEDDMAEYASEELDWKWTDETKTGLQGIRKRDGVCVFRWYPNQTQFFERFVLPNNVHMFNVEPRRLSLPEVMDTLMNALNSRP